MSQTGDSKGRPATLTSRLANSSSDSAARNHRQPTSSPGLSSSSGAATRRPSSSGGPGSRPSTPTGRSSSTLTTNSKSSRPSTPTSRTTTVSSSTTRPSLTSSRSTSSATTKPRPPPMSRSTSSSSLTRTTSKPTTRPSAGSATTRSTTTSTATTRSAGPSRSTTPLSRSTARSSTPTSRPTLPPPAKTISRSSTPTRRPSAATTTTSKPSQIKPSSPAAKPMPTPSKTPAVSRAPSPTVRSRPWKPSDMPGFSLETPPNLRTTLPERPLSATRGRPGAPSPRSNSVEPGGLGRPRRQSCSPSRGRAPMHTSGSSVPAVNRGYSKANDNVSPVLMGAKMVERVINMRKLAPPRSDEKGSPHGNLSAKSSSPDSAGFGRNLSKKSLDMAIRHMDIRRTIPGNLRPLMTNIPASSMYSVRSGHTRGRPPMNVSDSPLATSSNASSEISVYNNNGMCLEAASEKEDDVGSERGCRSPASSLQGR